MNPRTRSVTCLFLDIGGVLLTDGWSHRANALAVKTFGLDAEELKNRHNQALDTFELGKFTLEEYLRQVVFYEKRPFQRVEDDDRNVMCLDGRVIGFELS
jgi:putative hydrolase of the HAD superfamily